MASEVVHVIDPDSGSGYDYDSLYDWEAAEQGDLTGVRDEISVAKCRCTGGTADTTAVTIDGWTTSATQYIKIWTDTVESYRHNGTFQTGNKYRIAASVAYGGIILISELFVRIIGIQIYNTYSSSGDAPTCISISGIGTTSSSIRIAGCIIRGGYVSGGTGIRWTQGSMSIFIINNMIYDLGYSIRSGYVYESTNTIIYNNTFHNFVSATLFLEGNSQHSVRLKNNLFISCVMNKDLDGAWTEDVTNASNASPTVIDLDGDNFHLSSGDTVAKGQGTNLYNDATYPFQDDIDGDDRGGSGASWDIGADEYVGASAVKGGRGNLGIMRGMSRLMWLENDFLKPIGGQ